jgi:hypothetical protein
MYLQLLIAFKQAADYHYLANSLINNSHTYLQVRDYFCTRADGKQTEIVLSLSLYRLDSAILNPPTY